MHRYNGAMIWSSPFSFHLKTSALFYHEYLWKCFDMGHKGIIGLKQIIDSH